MFLDEKFKLWISQVEECLTLDKGYLLNSWEHFKKRLPDIRPDGKCHYTGWGRCGASTAGLFCEKHIKVCKICGAPITKDCTNIIGSLMCGAPKCDDHPTCRCR